MASIIPPGLFACVFVCERLCIAASWSVYNWQWNVVSTKQLSKHVPCSVFESWCFYDCTINLLVLVRHTAWRFMFLTIRTLWFALQLTFCKQGAISSSSAQLQYSNVETAVWCSVVSEKNAYFYLYLNKSWNNLKIVSVIQKWLYWFLQSFVKIILSSV